jgi:hypothetical protein
MYIQQTSEFRGELYRNLSLCLYADPNEKNI